MSHFRPLLGIYVFSTTAGGAFLSHRNTEEMGWKRPGERVAIIASSSLLSPIAAPFVFLFGFVAVGAAGLGFR
ncbi:MAG: hypothetical protein ACYCQJ_12110 [Nitrososphaerales archaeon]